jgi:hypothetical protein
VTVVDTHDELDPGSGGKKRGREAHAVETSLGCFSADVIFSLINEGSKSITTTAGYQTTIEDKEQRRGSRFI